MHRLALAALLALAVAAPSAGASSKPASSHALLACMTSGADGFSDAFNASMVSIDWMRMDGVHSGAYAQREAHLVARLEHGRWVASWRPAAARGWHGARFARCAG